MQPLSEEKALSRLQRLCVPPLSLAQGARRVEVIGIYSHVMLHTSAWLCPASVSMDSAGACEGPGLVVSSLPAVPSSGN